MRGPNRQNWDTTHKADDTVGSLSDRSSILFPGSPVSPLLQDRMGREKDVSTRLIRPTIPEFDTERLLMFVERWDPNWEFDASIKIFDEGIAQYMLTDVESHYKYMAALILSKPSLRCRLVEQEPDDVLDAEGNRITLTKLNNLSIDEINKIEYMKQVLHKRGYRFD